MKLLASIGLLVISLVASGGRAFAGTIYASGQLFIPAVPNVHDDIRENRIFAIDTLTGLATPLTPTLTGTPAGLAGTTDGRLLGFNSGRLGEVSLPSGTFSNLGAPSGVSATGFDVMSNGRGYVVPFTGNRQLHEINLATGAVSGIGTATTIRDALDAHYGLASGTSAPFIISLGSVGAMLYGVNLEDGRTNLLAINLATGIPVVIGVPNAVATSNGGGYSGFAAMTGVDENNDGQFDTLYGNVNFFDHDNNSATPNQRLGGLARYDLNDGTWSLVGSNPGLIFFGFGSSPVSVAEPAMRLLLGLGLLCVTAKTRPKRGLER